jgi:hypothetical protein
MSDIKLSGIGQNGGLTRDKALIRAAGERAVVSELSRRGALAALVAEGARRVVVASKGPARVTIQVKTRGQRRGSFQVQNVSEDFDFCVFVILGEPDDYWVIPTRELMTFVREVHEAWLRTPRRDGRPHDPKSPMMIKISLVADRFAHFHNAWDHLWEAL